MQFNDLKLRARALFKPRKVERELDDELAFHIACETQKLIAGGLSAAEARQRALARFGSLPLAADQCRDQRRIAFFETLTRDVGFAMRTFRRAPLVALTVVSTIALGLGRRRTIGRRSRSSIDSGRGKRGTVDGSTSSDG